MSPPLMLTQAEQEEFADAAEFVWPARLCSALFATFVEELLEFTGFPMSSALREAARRIEKIHRMSLHCSPSVVARVLRDFANRGRQHIAQGTIEQVLP
jgi:hypothetical protein